MKLKLSIFLIAFALGSVLFSGGSDFGATTGITREWIPTSTTDTGLAITQSYRTANNKPVYLNSTATTTGNFAFMGELLPDGLECSNNQILKKTGANNWDCAADNDSGGAGASNWNEAFLNALTPTNTSAGLFIRASSTFDSTLRINGAFTVNASATTTATSTARGLKIENLLSCNTIDTNAEGHFVCGTDDTGAGGTPGSWHTLFTNTLTPTNTSAGIFVNASSTFNSDLRINGMLRATSSLDFWLNNTTTLDLTTLQVATTLNLSGASITNYFGTACSGNQWLQDIGDNGSFSCSNLDTSGSWTGTLDGIDSTGFALAGTNGAWQTLFTNGLAPTNTSAGIFVYASSTFNSTLRVNGNATTSGYFVLGTTNPSNNMAAGDLFVGGNATTTATTTARGLKVENLISCNTIDTTAEGHFVCGSDATGAGGTGSNWLVFGAPTYISPSTTVGLIVSASSTIDSSLRVTGLLNGLDARLAVLNASSTMIGTLNLNGGSITNYFGTACAGNSWLQDIADNGSFSCGALSTTGDWTGTLDGLEASAFARAGFNGAWETIFTNTLSPTNTSAGIFVYASSTFNSTLRVNGNATTTTSLWVGSGGTANTLNLAGGDLYVQDGLEVDGLLFNSDARLATLNSTSTLSDTLRVGTNASPLANDGAALGTTSLMWSDLFLASGAVINWNNGDLTLTHSADLLTLAGGGLDLGGADSFELPNGTNPTVNAIGEMALDTTKNMFLMATSTDATEPTVFATGLKSLYQFTVASTTALVSGTNIDMPVKWYGFSTVRIQCYTRDGTSILVNLSDGTNDTNQATCTSSSEGTYVTTTSNNTWTASEKIRAELGTNTGSVTGVTISVFGVITRE